MTVVATHPRARRQTHLEAVAPDPRTPINWAALGVIMAVVVHAAAAVWFASSLDRRVTNIEQQLPPGAIARLDERTAQMSRTLENLERRR